MALIFQCLQSVTETLLKPIRQQTRKLLFSELITTEFEVYYQHYSSVWENNLAESSSTAVVYKLIK